MTLSQISTGPSSPSSGRPVIGIVGATERLDDVPTQVVRNAYVEALTAVVEVDALVVPVNQADPARLLTRLDGLLFTGAISNLHPAHYGAPGIAGDYDLDRDACSLAALPQAAAMELPTLAICRGLQEMAVAFGGTLQSLDAESAARHAEDVSLPRDLQYLPVHAATVEPGGILEEIFGPVELPVNSLHRQAVRNLGPRLRCEALAPDGVVEAASLSGSHSFMLGVQWHPEWHVTCDPVSVALFEAFGTAVREQSPFCRAAAG